MADEIMEAAMEEAMGRGELSEKTLGNMAENPEIMEAMDITLKETSDAAKLEEMRSELGIGEDGKIASEDKEALMNRLGKAKGYNFLKNSDEFMVETDGKFDYNASFEKLQEAGGEALNDAKTEGKTLTAGELFDKLKMGAKFFGTAMVGLMLTEAFLSNYEGCSCEGKNTGNKCSGSTCQCPGVCNGGKCNCMPTGSNCTDMTKCPTCKKASDCPKCSDTGKCCNNPVCAIGRFIANPFDFGGQCGFPSWCWWKKIVMWVGIAIGVLLFLSVIFVILKHKLSKGSSSG